MLKIETKIAGHTNNTFPHNNILNHEGTLNSIGFLDTWLDARSVLAFSVTCRAAAKMSSRAMKKNLLTAVVCGDEDLAKKIVKFYPELLLDSSTSVTDLSGKKIEGLTPLRAAICAGDVDMAQMMKEVLQQNIQRGIKLSFAPELEIQRQFAVIYPDGIDSVEATQKVQAQEFKLSKLNEIFDTINAATDEQVKFELDNPGSTIIATDEEVRFEIENLGIISARRQLNAALRTFREQFAFISNQELIFNPFYLLKAFEFYVEQFNNFNGNEDDKWNRRNLFWWQVIGYTQRHLPACYLQAFAQGIYCIIENREKLKRDFEFKCYKPFSMLPVVGDFNGLGYNYAGLPAAWPFPWGRESVFRRPCAYLKAFTGLAFFKSYCKQRNQVWRTYALKDTMAVTPGLGA